MALSSALGLRLLVTSRTERQRKRCSLRLNFEPWLEHPGARLQERVKSEEEGWINCHFSLERHERLSCIGFSCKT